MRKATIRPNSPQDVDEARALVDAFVDRYNHVRLHSAIGFVTPADKLHGREQAIWQQRDQKLEAARATRAARRAEQLPAATPLYYFTTPTSRVHAEAVHPLVDRRAASRRLAINAATFYTAIAYGCAIAERRLAHVRSCLRLRTVIHRSASSAVRAGSGGWELAGEEIVDGDLGEARDAEREARARRHVAHGMAQRLLLEAESATKWLPAAASHAQELRARRTLACSCTVRSPTPSAAALGLRPLVTAFRPSLRAYPRTSDRCRVHESRARAC